MPGRLYVVLVSHHQVCWHAQCDHMNLGRAKMHSTAGLLQRLSPSSMRRDNLYNLIPWVRTTCAPGPVPLCMEGSVFCMEGSVYSVASLCGQGWHMPSSLPCASRTLSPILPRGCVSFLGKGMLFIHIFVSCGFKSFHLAASPQLPLRAWAASSLQTLLVAALLLLHCHLSGNAGK